MARITNFLKLWLPESNEVYNVEKDQNENFEKIDAKLKEWDTGKEPKIAKKTGFNLDKTDLTENNSNKLFTAKGALDLFNKLTTAISTAVEAAKTALRLDIVKKIDKTAISSSLTSTSTATVLSSAGAKALEDKKLNIADAWRFKDKPIGNAQTNTDLNTITEVGRYVSASNSYLYTNKPDNIAGAFLLEVESIQPAGASYINQTIKSYSSNIVYRRSATSGTSSWFNWERIDGGDRLPLSGGTINGHLAINNTSPFLELKRSGTRTMAIGTTSNNDDITWYANIHKTYISLKKDDIYFNKHITANGTISIDGSKGKYFEIKENGVRKMFLGHRNNTDPDIVLYSDEHNTELTLKSDRIYTNKDIYSGNSKVATELWVGTNRTWNNLSGKPKFTNSVSSTATNEFAVPASVKTAYDRGSAALTEAGKKLPLSGGTITGNLTVTGTILSNSNISAYSDKRLKKDIKKIENALNRITQINGYTFNMNGEKRTGVIAQELQQILPEAVIETDTEEKYLSVAYGNMAGLFIEAIKELKIEIDALKMKVGD